MKYYGSKNNIDFGFYNEPFENAIEITDEQWKILQAEQSLGRSIVSDNNSVFSTETPDKFYVDSNGLWHSRSDEIYTEILSEKDKKQNINKLKNKIESLDKKRIRAICEPEIKNMETGETWLDYYNAQIICLRNELINLERSNNENENL